MHTGGRVLLRSRQGTDMTDSFLTGSFPEIRAAALAQLPADTGLDGELVVWESGRLAFERLQQRLARRGKGASKATGQWPAHYVVFDLLHQGGLVHENGQQMFTTSGGGKAHRKIRTARGFQARAPVLRKAS
ncbi:hypothetical protein [Streptomyces sp. NPDC085932]|uniref:ATP-dependent DNA ligase n=1 Tax=Streptomyces sp. NPDC085932 TaxID=3365741 RepID=UPI0037CCCB31